MYERMSSFDLWKIVKSEYVSPPITIQIMRELNSRIDLAMLPPSSYLNPHKALGIGGPCQHKFIQLFTNTKCEYCGDEQC